MGAISLLNVTADPPAVAEKAAVLRDAQIVKAVRMKGIFTQVLLVFRVYANVKGKDPCKEGG